MCDEFSKIKNLRCTFFLFFHAGHQGICLFDPIQVYLVVNWPRKWAIFENKLLPKSSFSQSVFSSKPRLVVTKTLAKNISLTRGYIGINNKHKRTEVVTERTMQRVAYFWQCLCVFVTSFAEICRHFLSCIYLHWHN